MDVNEPDELAQKYLTDHSLEQYYGEVLVPLLCLLEEERHFRAMDPSQREFVLDRTRDLIEDAAERADITTAADSGEAIDTPGPEEVSASAMLQEAESPKAPAQPPMVLNLPADDAADELAARMLTILLQRRGIAAATIRAGSPRGLHFADAENGGVAAVCISSISPAAAVRARRRVRRARASAPGAAIVLGLWQASDPAQARSQLRGQSNDAVIVTDLSGAVSQLASLCGMGESLDAGKQPRRPTTSPA
jgi:hypothetical protein